MQRRKAKKPQRMQKFTIIATGNGGPNKNQQAKWLAGATAACFIGIGAVLGNISERYGEIKEQEAKVLAALSASQEAEEQKNVDLSEKIDRQERMLAIHKENGSERIVPPPYEPMPDKLNLAYYYPEDAESDEIINSYAGQVFQELMIMDLDWLANLYELSDISPQKMASRLGKGQKSIMGGYNPRDKAHKANNPSTWIIHDWKKIHVNFINGDGRKIDGFSNVQDILSIASVYTYYNGMMDVDAFAEYSRQLWKDSHSYSLSMGDLYYCSGCLNKTEEELVREAEADELAENSSAAKTEPLSSGHDLESQSSGYGTAGGKKQINKADKNTDSGQDLSDGQGAAAGEAGLSDGQGAAAGEAGLSDGQGMTASGQGLDEQDNQQGRGNAVSGNAHAAENLQKQVSSQNMQSTQVHEGQTFGNGNGRAAGTANSLASSSDSLHLPESTSNGQETDNASNHSTEEKKNTQRITTQYDCPGHVDLYIQVKITGLKDKKGLFSIAKKAENAAKAKHAEIAEKTAEPETTAEWEGWTEENIAFVNKISNQDWFNDYGLSISSISLSNPLSNQEIDAYMNQLPPDTSVTRRNIIHFALSSVGRVPYYWGGKAVAPGYEGNNFGALVPSDDKGRILRGLDCSGWVSWVYWSATGKRLAGESTSSLCLCGKKISRSELKPGDIIVRTGTGAHVVMFLSWNADGRMNVIHESSASVNNVAVKTMDAPWPYYRKLVE